MEGPLNGDTSLFQDRGPTRLLNPSIHMKGPLYYFKNLYIRMEGPLNGKTFLFPDIVPLDS